MIAFFIQDLRAGGAERNVARIASGIAARGIEVDLVVVHRSGPFFDELDRRVNVIELPQVRTMTSVLGLKRYIESRCPVALLSSLTHTNVAAILANLAARPRTTLAVIERNEISLNRKVQTGMVRVAYGLVPWLYPHADILAAVSGGVRDDLAQVLRIDPDRINVLYNPVVSDDVINRSLLPLAHPWLDRDEIPVILGVGRLHPQKNFPLLIRATSLVLRQRPIRLIILGEGLLRAELEHLAQSMGIGANVSFPGFDSNPFRYMRRSSVYVMSSSWEGLPTTLIEAMACGAPVIATDCRSGPREILLEGKLGRLVPVDNPEALAGAIIETLASPSDRRARIARAHEFNLQSAVDRYLSVIGWSH